MARHCKISYSYLLIVLMILLVIFGTSCKEIAKNKYYNKRNWFQKTEQKSHLLWEHHDSSRFSIIFEGSKCEYTAGDTTYYIDMNSSKGLPPNLILLQESGRRDYIIDNLYEIYEVCKNIKSNRIHINSEAIFVEFNPEFTFYYPREIDVTTESIINSFHWISEIIKLENGWFLLSIKNEHGIT